MAVLQSISVYEGMQDIISEVVIQSKIYDHSEMTFTHSRCVKSCVFQFFFIANCFRDIISITLFHKGKSIQMMNMVLSVSFYEIK